MRVENIYLIAHNLISHFNRQVFLMDCIGFNSIFHWQQRCTPLQFCCLQVEKVVLEI
jgi:aminoglycoside phosphotransferase family enzyme